MEIAGGLYHELVEVPQQHSIYGSGGRAAIAISELTKKCILHTYSSQDRQTGIEKLKLMGINIQAREVLSGIAFAYFHPLSNPHIEPEGSSIQKNPPLLVSGKAVLRFGMLEGSAIVDAAMAVYDPQNPDAIERFHTNGSRAGKLAMVLNETELYRLTGGCDLESSATKAIQTEKLSALVVKRGVKGAVCFDSDGLKNEIPAFQTNWVTKIGTGDVFSAIFSHYWAEKRCPAAKAAAIASKTVAAYSLSGFLPANPDLIDESQSVKAQESTTVLLEKANNGLGQRYVLEQARNNLIELGIGVHCPEITSCEQTYAEKPKALFFSAEPDSKSIEFGLKRADELNLPVVILVDGDIPENERFESTARKFICSDYSTAIYNVGWIAQRSISPKN